MHGATSCVASESTNMHKMTVPHNPWLVLISCSDFYMNTSVNYTA